MSSYLQYLLRRLLAIPITLLILTAVMYGILMLAPVEARVQLYMPRSTSNNPHLRPEVLRQQIIDQKGLDDPYPVQYARWVASLLRGDWGWSPGLRGDVLDALLARTPATAELTLYAVLLMVPLGIASGVIAGWRQNRAEDYGFRLLAFVATSIPPFILGLVLLGIFYAGLNWFPAGRLSISETFVVTANDFTTYTGLLTLDGLLNGRVDITLSALRHLALPVITLSLAHWATLGRVTRAVIIEELGKDYVITAHGKGLPQRSVVWGHVARNAMLPALNSSALSAAALVMGVFVIEVVFGFPGVSELIAGAVVNVPDVPVAMGFAVYSILLVLPLMLALDIMQGLVDPRLRESMDAL
ncbi:MAG: ABC transporter permease [Anaerolineales bacterium]|nr:ABC transporter permease [Anaerolineales bacterium]